MKSDLEIQKCSVCFGNKKVGTTTLTVDYKSGVLVVRNVPADICSQCGAEWIADTIAAKLETVADNARNAKKQIEVVDFSLTVAA